MKLLSKFMTIILVCIIIGFVININLKQDRYNKRFYKEAISSRISKIEYKNRGGYIYYYGNSYFYASTFMTREGMVKEDSLLKIGDSILKKPRSFELKVYRKINEDYKYYKTFYGSEK